jgi:hypothetical protein
VASMNRSLFCTKGSKAGFLGMSPQILEPGDVVCILPCSVMFVLRPVEDYYLLPGECYVDGIMYSVDVLISARNNCELLPREFLPPQLYILITNRPGPGYP